MCVDGLGVSGFKYFGWGLIFLGGGVVLLLRVLGSRGVCLSGVKFLGFILTSCSERHAN